MLITCPECGGRVSDQAAACPACGFPVERMAQRKAFIVYDPAVMTGKTEADLRAIEIAAEFYGELLVSGDGRVWNSGGQVVAEMKYRDAP